MRTMKGEGAGQVQGADGPQEKDGLGVFWPWPSVMVVLHGKKSHRRV